MSLSLHVTHLVSFVPDYFRSCLVFAVNEASHVPGFPFSWDHDVCSYTNGGYSVREIFEKAVEYADARGITASIMVIARGGEARWEPTVQGPRAVLEYRGTAASVYVDILHGYVQFRRSGYNVIGRGIDCDRWKDRRAIQIGHTSPDSVIPLPLRKAFAAEIECLLTGIKNKADGVDGKHRHAVGVIRDEAVSLLDLAGYPGAVLVVGRAESTRVHPNSSGITSLEFYEGRHHFVYIGLQPRGIQIIVTEDSGPCTWQGRGVCEDTEVKRHGHSCVLKCDF